MLGVRHPDGLFWTRSPWCVPSVFLGKQGGFFLLVMVFPYLRSQSGSPEHSLLLFGETQWVDFLSWNLTLGYHLGVAGPSPSARFWYPPWDRISGLFPILHATDNTSLDYTAFIGVETFTSSFPQPKAEVCTSEVLLDSWVAGRSHG